MMAGLLDDAKNYLDITWKDEGTERKLAGVLKRGMDYLDRAAGAKQDYEAEGAARALLFDYCRYAMNNALELFEGNFRAELIALRMEVQAHDHAEWESGV